MSLLKGRVKPAAPPASPAGGRVDVHPEVEEEASGTQFFSMPALEASTGSIQPVTGGFKPVPTPPDFKPVPPEEAPTDAMRPVAMPASPAPAPAVQLEAGAKAGSLARSQSADGSFGGDVARTIVAMLLLVKDGHTRRKGLRKRVVGKAAAWLEARRAEPGVALALAILADVEQGKVVDAERWQQVVDAVGAVAQPLV